MHDVLASTLPGEASYQRLHTTQRRVLGRAAGMLAMSIMLSACAGPLTVGLSKGHVFDAEEPVAEAPPLTPVAPVVPPPSQVEPVATYTVVVKQVPVIDLLFSLARDAGIDLDLQSESDRTVTINAVERPLPEILNRITSQAGLRYRLRGSGLVVEDDQPYWKNYSVDYVNISRNSEGEVGVATQIATTGGTVGEDVGGQQGDQNGNLSKTTVRNRSENDFWMALELGLRAAVADMSTGVQEAVAEQQNPVIVNAMAGMVTVYGGQAEHLQVSKYLDKLMANSKRQVLIEMTIVEVELSDNYQAGVDWSRLIAEGSDGLSVRSQLLGPDLSTPPAFSLDYINTDSSGDALQASVRLLQQFGDTRVLSSPKIMALNNQTAILKVVNETVYFNIELDIRDATADIPERRTFTTEINTVPVGLVMSVTPQISNNGYVSLNIRPTISRITGFAVDPAPRLAGVEFDNLIPEIQVREIESLLQVLDGRTIVLGGLMQNEQESKQDGVPGLSRIPGVGKLFSYNRDELVKTELVIFLKPTIIEDATSPPGAPQLADYYDAESSNVIGNVDYR
ncbi:MAG: pilus (MSHA type) biogenesis protein MshL [Pseudomonadota bacterium]